MLERAFLLSGFPTGSQRGASTQLACHPDEKWTYFHITGWGKMNMPPSLPQVSLPQDWEQRVHHGDTNTVPSLAFISGMSAASMQGRTAGECCMGCQPHLNAINSPPQ